MSTVMTRLSLLPGCLVFLAAPSLPASAAEGLCVATDEVQAILDEVGEIGKDCRSEACWTRQREALEEALEEHPGDFFLHESYQRLFDRYRVPDSVDAAAEREKLRSRYENLAAERPEDPAAQYLYGRLLDEDAEGAAKLFSRAGELDPGFPWGYRGLALLAAREMHGTKEEGRQAIERFVDLCPGKVSRAVLLASMLDAPELAADFAARARRELEAEGEEAEFYNYTSIWSAEFQARPPSEHGALREQVRRDVARLEALDRWDDGGWIMARQNAYEILGEEEKLAALRAEQVRREPCTDEAVRAAVEAWDAEHPRPPAAEGAEAEKTMKEWNRLRRVLTSGLVERCPESYTALREHFFALDVDTPREERIAVGRRFADEYQAAKDQGHMMSPSPYFFVARSFLDDDVAFYEEIPALIEKSMREDELRQSRRSLAGLDEKMRKMMERGDFYSDWRNRTALTEARIRLGELEEGLALVDELKVALDSQEPGEDAETEAVSVYQRYASDYWRLLGLLAEGQGRKLDAVAYYRRSHAQRPQEKRSIERAGELWREAGGTDDGFAALDAASQSDAAESSLWADKDQELADFELQDLGGETWTLAKFEGKKVFVNIWATWCGPCRVELPYVQKLHKKLTEKEGGDILLVTLNMDFNPGVVAPYMQKSGFTFPVLLASDYLEKQEVNGIPRNWILSGGGRIYREQVGFSPELTTEDWMAEIFRELEEAPTPGGP